MAQRKPPKRLFKNKDVVHVYQHDRENNTSMKRMVRDHVDLLEDIETIVLAYARKMPEVDDRTIDEALELLRRDKENLKNAELHVKSIGLLLNQVRSRHPESSDTIWLGALRTVQDSVRRHSSLSPGEKGYLEFLSEYI